MTYSRVDMINRYDIDWMLREGKNQKQIAKALGFHPSTICRELKRLKRTYHYGHFQEDADFKLCRRTQARKLRGDVLKFVLEKLALYWSPEQISQSMKVELGQSISHETIYRYLKQNRNENGLLYKYLRRSGRKRKSRFPNEKRLSKRDRLPCIENRSEDANKRKTCGHWERDLMFGKNRKKTVLVLVDRKSRYTKLKLLDNKKAQIVNYKTTEALKSSLVKSITNDRGSEFLQYEALKKALNVKIYFCHPYTSQERGTNENTIGLVRQFLPKRKELEGLSQVQLDRIENLLNKRPRKILNWKSPLEVFSRENNCDV
jgi:transposase, IS30 family